jgi:hypothetical protein
MFTVKQCRKLSTNESIRIWKEEVVAGLKAVTWSFPAVLEKVKKNLGQDIR